MTDKWVLPLTIVDDASYNYQGHPRKNYAKALLRVIPFNDYSGSYSTSTMEVYIRNANGSTDNKPMVTNNRTAYVVDNNTIFFYAGLMSEDLSRDERELYKIYIRFNEDKSLSMWADDEEKIGFKLYGTPLEIKKFFIKLKEQCYWNEISILRFQTKISRLNGK